jgi:hypothetical protein
MKNSGQKARDNRQSLRNAAAKSCSPTTARLNRGLTLLEAVIAIGIATVLLVALASLYAGYIRFYSYAKATSETVGGANAAADELQDLVRQADAVMSTAIVNGASYASGSSTLVLELPSITASGSVVANTYDYAVFYTSGTSLYRVLSASGASSRVSSTKRLSETVSSVTFTYDTVPALASVVTADLVMQSRAAHDTAQTDVTVKMYVRNR